MQCPCGSTQTYSACCEPIHGGNLADSPEALMRARFSAFTLELPRFLEASWHPSTRPQLSLVDNPKWVKLEVVSSWAKGDTGFVHFRAYYDAGLSLGMMEEKSDFVSEQGQWFYVQGEVLA